MAYCTNCGNYVDDNANFCGSCGAKMTTKTAPIKDPTSSAQQPKGRSNQRETVYEGEIHKCPNCGATLSAFVKSCPECGYELRSTASAYSVQEFSRSYAIATSNSQKIDLIRTFVIPNTKEDILEFVILASSNINSSSYARNSAVSGDVSQQNLTDAWMAKFDQAHQKANLILSDDPYLEKINKLYADKKKELGNAKTVSVGKNILSSIFGNEFVKIMLPFVILMALIPLIFSLTGPSERKLERQVKQIEAYIAEENYDAALTTAYSMSDNYSSSWSATRANLISRIQELQASKKGEAFGREGLVQIPTQEMVGKQISDVVSIFTSAGFTNVTSEPVQSDLLTGWLNKLVETSGEVGEISIEGDTNYTLGAWVSPDTPVMIRYYE